MSNIGIIGGSGLYKMDGVKVNEEFRCDTPFGKPSDVVFEAAIGDKQVFFLPRHARGHKILPHEINHKANIYALKELGVQWIIAVSAVGSLKEDYKPGDIVLPDQYFDRTKRSEEHTFFGHGIVAHISFADPVCPNLHPFLAKAARAVTERHTYYKDVNIHEGGTYVNMEGPAFSTKAESHFHRQCGFDVIGMTSLAEAKLAREAGMCYSTMAMVTDYDCWHEAEAPVTVEAVLEIVKANTRLAQDIITEAVTTHNLDPNCSCTTALGGAIMTDPTQVPNSIRKKLGPILGDRV